MDFDTRKLGTLGSIRTPKQPLSVRRSGEFGFNITSLTNPMPTTDDWAVLSDGAVALVRSRDYRIEYLNPDGTWKSSAKQPFDWHRMTDDDKQKMVDSVKAVQRRQAMTSYVAGMIRWVNMYKQQYPDDFKVPDGFISAAGLLEGLEDAARARLSADIHLWMPARCGADDDALAGHADNGERTCGAGSAQWADRNAVVHSAAGDGGGRECAHTTADARQA